MIRMFKRWASSRAMLIGGRKVKVKRDGYYHVTRAQLKWVDLSSLPFGTLLKVEGQSERVKKGEVAQVRTILILSGRSMWVSAVHRRSIDSGLVTLDSRIYLRAAKGMLKLCSWPRRIARVDSKTWSGIGFYAVTRATYYYVFEAWMFTAVKAVLQPLFDFESKTTEEIKRRFVI
jgi:hypothetical protein